MKPFLAVDLGSIFADVFNFVADVGDGVGGFMKSAVNEVADGVGLAFEAAMRWSICFLFNLVEPLVQGLIDGIPDDHVDIAADVLTWLGKADAWFPFSYLFVLIGAYVAFVAVYAFVHLVVKLIPFVG